MQPGPRILVSTVPKSGTHLVDSILALMPPMKRRERLGLTSKLRWHPYNYLPFGGSEKCLMGIGRPHSVKLSAVSQRLDVIQPWEYGLGQIPYDRRIVELALAKGIKPVVSIRDPRDILVSLMHHVLDHDNHFLQSRIRSMSSNRERLLALIEGVRSESGELRRGVSHQLDLILGWTEDPDVLTMRFENLIGTRGGGDADRQHASIKALASLVGLSLSDAEIARVGDEMFGKGKTFRQGKVSSWREYLDDELLTAYYKETGDRLPRMGYAI